ncbi:MAG: hypothetical protein EOM23_07260 [Candidatus Moranbacteria bacterium]|jgi:hypothetical protein|nr:hypothetical protein [Candidatus Moranbacteria bacterium]
MKNKKIELDVDFIGNQETLTREEEKKLSDYFKKRKLVSQKRHSTTSSKTAKHRKTTVEG